jgi:HSP20 family protein
MSVKKDTALRPAAASRDPFAMLRQMTSDLDQMFDDAPWAAFRWPSLRLRGSGEPLTWAPKIDVFERDNRLVTKVDLPGMKKEDVKVEVTDGHLAISGERKRETEEKKERTYRYEREYGSFSRAIPLPEGVKLEDVKATFADGVLEVSVPLPAHAEAKIRQVEIKDAAQPARSAA